MPNWKKVIVSGSDAILNSITSSAGISSSGDIYAPNFIGTVSTASHALEANVTDYLSGGSLNLVVNGASNTLYNIPDNLTYNADTSTLTVTNLSGTASLATTASHALTASYIEGGSTINVINNSDNRVLTGRNDGDIQAESNLTFNGTTLAINGVLTVNPQGYQPFLDISSGPTGGIITLGDSNDNNNSVFLQVDDTNDNQRILLSFGDPAITHTFKSSGLNLNGSITASGDISASGTLIANGATLTGDLIVTGSQLITNNITSDGTIRARVKSFDIPHPTRKNKRLVYGVIEGPEHGIYCRGESKELKVLLPPEWRAMVDKKGITVQVTPIGEWQPLYFKKLHSNWLYFGCGDNREEVHFYWEIKGERTDVPKLQTVQ